MKRILISGAVLTLAITGVSSASAAPAVYKVTGGGQTLVPAGGGAGNTIAFSAQSQGDEGSAAKGQFQYVDRKGTGTGKGQEVVHGTVSCVVVFSRTDEGGMAVIGGTSREGEPFRIDVTDDGQGAHGNDMIVVRRGAAAQDGGDDDSGDTALCDSEDETADVALNRGNVKIHKAKA